MKESALKRVGVIGTGRIANRFMVGAGRLQSA